jgi:hypothetical protein
MENRDREFLEKLADLMNEYKVDFNINMAPAYDGDVYDSFSIENTYGHEVFNISRQYFDAEDIKHIIS